MSGSPSSSRASSNIEKTSAPSPVAPVSRRLRIAAYSWRSTGFRTRRRMPRGSALRMLCSSTRRHRGCVETRTSLRIVSRSRNSGVPRAGAPWMPKMPVMITSSVTACMRDASESSSPTCQRSISRSATSLIIPTYRSTASPWKAGSSSLRCRMCRSPTEVSTEFGPRNGRSGDSPVSDGASAGFAVNSDFTWSGWLVTTNGSSRLSSRTCQTSP